MTRCCIEMNRTFNNGIGMVLNAASAVAASHSLRETGEDVYQTGLIAARSEGREAVVVS